MMTLKVTKGKSNKQKKSAKKVPEPRLNNVIKPEGMGLEEWQYALRKQAAEKEMLGVQAVNTRFSPGEYRVTNPKSREKYFLKPKQFSARFRVVRAY